jgi:two-component system, OmpR family, alkaline phosphatase synthesis response regulator PhoP
VDAYIHYLREKLGAAGRLIETVRGIGYRMADA